MVYRRLSLRSERWRCEKRLFANTLILKKDCFTTTGSGQTKEGLRDKAFFRRKPQYLRILLRCARELSRRRRRRRCYSRARACCRDLRMVLTVRVVLLCAATAGPVQPDWRNGERRDPGEPWPEQGTGGTSLRILLGAHEHRVH
jgi:hypothetical protein